MTLFDKLFPKKVLPGRLSEEEGFLDIDLPLTAVDVGPSGEVRFTARGEVVGFDTGFAFVLHSNWDPQPLEDSSAIQFRSLAWTLIHQRLDKEEQR